MPDPHTTQIREQRSLQNAGLPVEAARALAKLHRRVNEQEITQKQREITRPQEGPKTESVRVTFTDQKFESHPVGNAAGVALSTAVSGGLLLYDMIVVINATLYKTNLQTDGRLDEVTP